MGVVKWLDGWVLFIYIQALPRPSGEGVGGRV